MNRIGVLEELREALLNLDEARAREEKQRKTAEALLAGLHVLVTTTDEDTLFPKLFTIMKEPLDFDAAIVLWIGDDGSLTPVSGASSIFNGVSWHAFELFNRAMLGKPVAVYDTSLIDEWRSVPEAAGSRTSSALVFPIRTIERRALFICTHPDRAHFTQNHIHLARRFSVLASQALRQMESAVNLANLQEQLIAKEKLSELNRKLADNERVLAKARKMEALGLLAGGVAHDLNNILSGIVSYPDLMLMDDDLSDEYREVLETMQEAGNRAVAVVADLLTVARGVTSIRKVENLNDLIAGHIRSPEHLQLTNTEIGTTFSTETDPELLNIKASELHIRKALMNLLTNAAEAVRSRPDGRITLSTQNRYVDQPISGYDNVRTGEYAILSVRDNGEGISPEDRERIFEPFYAKKQMGRSGTGLGLTIVWNTMQDHEGYIDVTSDETGTVFDLYFPVTREADEEQPEQQTVDDLRGNGELILVVDDQDDQRRIAQAFLRKLGYETHAVASGEKAVDYVRDRHVDLLILDMIMANGIGGRETYEQIAEFRPGQRAVIASGYSMNEDVRAAQESGAGSYLRKPYTFNSFGRAVKAELNRRD